MKEKTLKIWRRISLSLLCLATISITLESSLDSEHDILSMITNGVRDIIESINPKPEIPMTDIKITTQPDFIESGNHFHANAEAIPSNCSDPTIEFRMSDNLQCKTGTLMIADKIESEEENCWIEAYSETYNISKRYNFKIKKTYVNKDIDVAISSFYYSNLILKSRFDSEVLEFDLRENSECFTLPFEGTRTDGRVVSESMKYVYDDTYIEKIGDTCMFKVKDAAVPGTIISLKATNNDISNPVEKEVKIRVLGSNKANKIESFAVVNVRDDFKDGEEVKIVDANPFIVNTRYRIVPLDKDGKLTRAIYTLGELDGEFTKYYETFFSTWKYYNKKTYPISIYDKDGNKITKEYNTDYTYNPVDIKLENLIYDDKKGCYLLEAGQGARIIFIRQKESDLDNYVFTSSNPNIIEVDSHGYLQAKQAGKATITLKPYIETPVDLTKIFEIEVTGYSPTIKDESRFVKLMRKGMGHFMGFFVEGFLLASTILLYTLDSKKIAYGIPGVFLYAGLTEIIQYFVPGRCCTFTDVIIDSLGAFSGMVSLLLIYLIVKLVIYLIQKIGKNKN